MIWLKNFSNSSLRLKLTLALIVLTLICDFLALSTNKWFFIGRKISFGLFEICYLNNCNGKLIDEFGK